MTSYPDIQSSNNTNSTTNRGVEAKETEIANTQLDGDAESISVAANAAANSLDCPSYLQVRCGCGGGDGAGAGRWNGGAMLLTPCCPAAGNTSHPTLAYYLGDQMKNSEITAPAPPAAYARSGQQHLDQQLNPDEADMADTDAECVEVYRFSRVGGALCVGAGGRRARFWRHSVRLRQGARVAAAELGAATRLAFGAPLEGALLALRWSLQMARDAVSGTVHAGSDYVLKPALALLFNALLHPILVFVANLLQGVSVAVRPACAVLGECAVHTATVLSAARLVAVESQPHPCHCRCSMPAGSHTHATQRLNDTTAREDV